MISVVNIPWLILSYQHDIIEHKVVEDIHNGLSVCTSQLQHSNESTNQSNQIITYFFHNQCFITFYLPKIPPPFKCHLCTKICFPN